MFMPNEYAETDIEVQKEIIRKTGLGTIITTSEDGEFNANHLPFIVAEREGKLFLYAHFHVKNEIGKELDSLSPDKNVLIVFQGPHDYITPSWYPTKQENHKVAPTWLYAAVHVYGKPTVIKDLDKLHQILNVLTDHFESPREKPWSVDEAPEPYLNILKKSIYGLEIEVTKTLGKFKMNQAQKAVNLQGTVDGLKSRTDNPASQTLGTMVEEASTRYQTAKAAAKSEA